MLRAKVIGIPHATKAVRGLSGEIRRATERAVAEEADAVRDDMRSNAPRDTGELIDSIDDDAEGLKAWIRARARHAPFVEFGTTVQPARPYAQPAAHVAQRRLPARVARAVKEAT